MFERRREGSFRFDARYPVGVREDKRKTAIVTKPKGSAGDSKRKIEGNPG